MSEGNLGNAFAAGDTPYYSGVVERIGFIRERSKLVSYAFAFFLTLAAVGLRRWLDVLAGDIVPFALFYPVVLACTIVGGIGPGLLALVMSTLACTVFWLEPIGAFALTGSGPINLAIFAVTNGTVMVVALLLRSSYERLHRSEARLSLSQDVGNIGIWDLDLKTGALWWSPSFYRLIGISPDQPPDINAVLARVHPADRDNAASLLENARRGLKRLDLSFRLNRDDGTIAWLVGRAELFRDPQGRPSRLLGISFDATALHTLEGERDRAHALLRTFFDSLPGAAYVKDTEGRILLGNRGYADAFRQSPENLIGKTDIELLTNKEQARSFMEQDQAVIRGGVSQQFVEDVIDPEGRLTHWLLIKAPYKDDQGQPLGVVGMALDMTERRKAEKRLRTVADEVDHRAKNLLAVVQSIVRLTRIDDVAAFKSALNGRIQALARAHSLLAASRWDGVDLATLVREELAPFHRSGAEHIRISGPSLMLRPDTSQAVAMVLHELAINAVRFGCLSVEKGQLSVTWQRVERGGEAHIDLAWTEVCGHLVATPLEAGFGLTAMRGAIEHQLGGEFAIDWADTGVQCRISFPVARNVAEDQTAAPALPDLSPGERPGTPEIDLAGRRVLIVDDEALIALALKETVQEMGCEVLGPAHSVREAIALVRQGAPDLAVLDLNLSGSSNAPVARALRALDIPFVYCTGYAEPSARIEAGLDAEIIAKPADLPMLAAALKRAAARKAPDGTSETAQEPWLTRV